MKGVSTIVAIVLLLLITISLAGTAYMFFSGVFTGKTSTVFSINPSGENSIIITNLGNSPLDDLVFIVDDQMINVSGASNIPDDLVAYYPFSEGEGLVTADLGFYRNHGNLGNGTTGTEPSWIEGKFGNGLFFDGIYNFVEVPTSTSLEIENNITISTWVFLQGLSSQSDVDMILNKEGIPYEIAIQEPAGVHPSCGSNEYAQHFVWYLGGVSTDAIGTSCGWKLGSLEPIPTDTWTHIALTYDGTKIRTYVDGNLQYEFSGSGNIAETTNTVRIGNRGVTHPNSPFHGIIDEVKIYNTALSTERLVAEKNGNFYILPYQNAIVIINSTLLSSPGTHSVKICSSSMCSTAQLVT